MDTNGTKLRTVAYPEDYPHEDIILNNSCNTQQSIEKVSSCFCTDEGADLFAKLNSYLSTAKKRGCTSLRALELLFQGTPMLALEGATEE